MTNIASINPTQIKVDRGVFKKNQWDKILMKRAKKDFVTEGKPVTIYRTIGGSIASHI